MPLHISSVLLTLLVELFPFNSETTFKLFALNLPQIILRFWKASRQCSSHACCISGQKLFSWGCHARFISAGGLGWSCFLHGRWAEIAGVLPTLCVRVPPVFQACSLWRCSSSLRAAITNLVWPSPGQCYLGRCCNSLLEQIAIDHPFLSALFFLRK